MTNLLTAPNIGSVLAAELHRCGAGSCEELRELGAVQAWERLRTVSPERDCANSLLALEGAVRGLRWTSLPLPERRRISAYARARRTP